MKFDASDDHQPSTDLEHLRLLSLFYYVLSGLAFLCSFFPVIHLTVGIMIVEGGFPQAQQPQKGGGPPPELFGWIFIGVASACMLMGFAMSAAFRTVHGVNSRTAASCLSPIGELRLVELQNRFRWEVAMPEVVLLLTAAGVVVVVAFVAYYLHSIRRPDAAIVFESEREERLTRQMAETVCCLLATALASIRKELRIAPNMSDETIMKRALYHYRTALPEKVCSVFFDKKPG